jgi:hypothetical protein
LYGFVVEARNGKCNGLDVLVIIEEFLAERWIILYRKERAELTAFASYILFDAWSGLDFAPAYAPIVDVGLSLDVAEEYVIIEQNAQQRWVMTFDCSNKENRLVRELIMFPVWYQRGKSGRADLLEDERAAASALKLLPRVYGDIVVCQMVATLYSRKVYVVEESHGNKWLHVYNWYGTDWHLQATYKAIDYSNTGVCSLRAMIVEVFIRYNSSEDYLIVVEENRSLRWWHTYRKRGNSWEYMESSEVLLKRKLNLVEEQSCT